MQSLHWSSFLLCHWKLLGWFPFLGWSLDCQWCSVLFVCKTNKKRKPQIPQNQTQNKQKKNVFPLITGYLCSFWTVRLNLNGVCWLPAVVHPIFGAADAVHAWISRRWCNPRLLLRARPGEPLGLSALLGRGCRACASRGELSWGVIWLPGEVTENVFQGVPGPPLRLFFWLNFSAKVSCRWSVMMRFAFPCGECTFFTVLHLFTYSNKYHSSKMQLFWQTNPSFSWSFPQSKINHR